MKRRRVARLVVIPAMVGGLSLGTVYRSAAAAKQVAWAEAATDTLRLSRALEMAREANPGLQAARLRADAAQARVPQAGAFPDPMLSLGLANRPVTDLGRTDQPMTMNTIALTQRFPWPGKLGFSEERADHLAAAESLDAEEVERHLLAVRLRIKTESSLERDLVIVGLAAGVAAVVMYLARTSIPLPGFVRIGSFIFFGPALVVAFLGFYPFISRPRPSVPAILATVFGVIAGATNMMFAVVQLNNLHYIRGYMRAAESEAAAAMWRNILSGVFTVQNGINYVMDFFLDWTAFMYAVVMWNHPKFGKVFSLLSVVAVGPHFVMKLITFPEPPAEAGLFDAGPLIALWFAIVLVQVVRNLDWMGGREPPA